MEAIRIGSDEHGRLLCRTFIETHRPFQPRDIVWPTLDEEGLARLKSLPVWDEAVPDGGGHGRQGADPGRDRDGPHSQGGDRPPGLRGGAPRRDHRAA